jgi:sulfotransferase family protein
MSNPYVFIVGCPRSGTTLLQRIVNAHPQIAVTPESHWIPRLFAKGEGLTPEGLVTAQLAPRLLELPKFAALGIAREDLLKLVGNGEPVHYSSLVTAILDLYGKAQSKALVGDKTPDYVRWLDTLHGLWPEARFVHVIRDGRDVCLSIANWTKAHQKRPGRFTTWKDEPVSTTALWWELNVRLGRNVGKLIGARLYYEIRYEALVTHPREECEALCAFLGLGYHDAMLRFHEGRTRTEPGLSAKHAWLPVTAGLRDWRSQMPSGDIERVEAATGELLDELGYPRVFPRPGPERLENALRIREEFSRDRKWIRF